EGWGEGVTPHGPPVTDRPGSSVGHVWNVPARGLAARARGTLETCPTKTPSPRPSPPHGGAEGARRRRGRESDQAISKTHPRPYRSLDRIRRLAFSPAPNTSASRANHFR